MTDTTATTLVCPKCQGAMRSYERQGVTIDQCQECRGVFLDRGELDRLIDAEQKDYETTPKGSGYRQDPRDAESGGHHGGTRRRRGFLGELFD